MLIVAYPRNETFLERAPFPLQIERKLREMDRVLDDSKLVLAVSTDLAQSAPQAACNGRPTIPTTPTTPTVPSSPKFLQLRCRLEMEIVRIPLMEPRLRNSLTTLWINFRH